MKKINTFQLNIKLSNHVKIIQIHRIDRVSHAASHQSRIIFRISKNYPEIGKNL